MSEFSHEPSPSTSTHPLVQELRAHHSTGWPEELSIEPLAPNPLRRDHGDRSAFLISHRGSPLAHLTTGTGLVSHWQRTCAFHQALPTLAARPLFQVDGKTRSFLAREFVTGKTFSELVLTGRLSPSDAREQGLTALVLLEKTTTPSSVEAALAEAEVVLKQLSLLPACSAFDRAFFQELIAPVIRAGIASFTPQMRWTNGDFTPRNLVLREDGCIRLIDYEFATQTHFPDDVWRWNTFGVQGAIPRLTPPDSLPPWLEIFFWCRQLVLSHSTIVPEKASVDAEHAFDMIVSLLPTKEASWMESAFLRRLSVTRPLHAEIARLVFSETALSEKLARMHASRSWRYTAWLRAIRRLLNRSS